MRFTHRSASPVWRCAATKSVRFVSIPGRWWWSLFLVGGLILVGKQPSHAIHHVRVWSPLHRRVLCAQGCHQLRRAGEMDGYRVCDRRRRLRHSPVAPDEVAARAGASPSCLFVCSVFQVPAAISDLICPLVLPRPQTVSTSASYSFAISDPPPIFLCTIFLARAPDSERSHDRDRIAVL